MPLDALVKEATGLPDKYVEMAVTYIYFLQQQCSAEAGSEKKQRPLGILADRFCSMADDFDATPAEFEDYV